jgi:hypothetical protein
MAQKHEKNTNLQISLGILLKVKKENHSSHHLWRTCTETQLNNLYLLLFSLPTGARADDNTGGPEPVNVTSFLITKYLITLITSAVPIFESTLWAMRVKTCTTVLLLSLHAPLLSLYAFRFNLDWGGFILFCGVCMWGFCNVGVWEGFVMCGFVW